MYKVNGSKGHTSQEDWNSSKWAQFLILSVLFLPGYNLLIGATHNWRGSLLPQFAGLHAGHPQMHPEQCFTNLLTICYSSQVSM